jgi:coproporphyrinogen III oxidase-like Fe-S oxidoreductase
MLENYNYPKSWDNIRLSEDDFNSEYNEINLYLKQNDFDRYELSNFAIKNYECKHNI